MEAGLGWAGAPVGQAEGSLHLLPLPDVPTMGVGGSLGSGAALCEERVQTRGGVPDCAAGIQVWGLRWQVGGLAQACRSVLGKAACRDPVVRLGGAGGAGGSQPRA